MPNSFSALHTTGIASAPPEGSHSPAARRTFRGASRPSRAASPASRAQAPGRGARGGGRTPPSRTPGTSCLPRPAPVRSGCGMPQLAWLASRTASHRRQVHAAPTLQSRRDAVSAPASRPFASAQLSPSSGTREARSSASTPRCPTHQEVADVLVRLKVIEQVGDVVGIVGFDQHGRLDYGHVGGRQEVDVDGGPGCLEELRQLPASRVRASCKSR